MSDKIAAIVLTYRQRAHYLKKCLESLSQQTYPFEAIYVFDNNSHFTTKELVAEFQKKNNSLYYHFFSKNLGSTAYSLALEDVSKQNKYSWIFIIDDDGILRKDALENLLKSEKFNEKNSFLSCKRIDSDNKIEERERGWFNEFKLEVDPIKKIDYEKESVELGHSSYMGMLVNQKAISQCGFPDRKFYLYLDDIEYSMRLRKYGSAFLIPKSIVIHSEPRKERQIIKFGVKRTKIEDLWRDYYGFRNYFLLRKSVNRPIVMLIAIFFRFLRSLFAIIILDDNKIVRLNLLFKSLNDAIHKRFGETLIINDYLNSIKNGN
jgi:hypothetical protein